MKISLYAVVAVTIAACIIIPCAKLFIAKHDLEKANDELEYTRNLLEHSEAECTILREDSLRARAALEQYTKTIETQKAANEQKYKDIQNDESAADWLNTALPDSVRLLYDCTCRDDRVCANEASGDSDRAVCASCAVEDGDK